MHWFARALGLAALVGAMAVGSRAPAEELRIDTPDGARGAILLPAPGIRAPTVIVLHGALVSAKDTASWYGFGAVAEQHGFAAVFPRGLGLLWNDGRGGVWASAADDVAFLKCLARELVRRGTADPARLYLAGVSNGGMMALRMLCEASDGLAGVATVIASMPTGVGAGCRPRHPMPVILFNGTADPLIPYEGGGVGFSSLEGSVWSAEGTAAYLARVNGCGLRSRTAVAGSAAPDAMRVVRLDWTSCSSERGVALYRVEGGGHQVFGHTNYLVPLLGPGTDLISAPGIIMAAFARGNP
jgi:polyhydroxybutyrate depolymerase